MPLSAPSLPPMGSRPGFLGFAGALHPGRWRISGMGELHARGCDGRALRVIPLRKANQTSNRPDDADAPGGLANRSGAGDLDVIIYFARKWAQLALAVNPAVLLVLIITDEEVVFRNDAGAELADNAHRFVSRPAAGRFLG